MRIEEGTAPEPNYTIYWGNQGVGSGTYVVPEWFDSPPVCTCEATWDHTIWTHWYRLLTMNKKVWRSI